MERHIRPCSNKLNFYIHKTTGDGSCLIHAILYSISPRYRNMTSPERNVYVKKIRGEMAEILPEHWDKLNTSELSKVYPDKYSLEGIQRHLRSTEYLDEFSVWFLEEIFNINIIVFSEKDDSIYERGIIKKDRKATTLINYTGNHFETILYNHRKGNYLVSFKNDSRYLRKFLE